MNESLLQFFAEYRAARSTTDRGQMQIAAELKRSFHVSDRPSDDVEKWLHAREGEEVTDTVDHGQRAEVLTTGDLAGAKRYLVVRNGQGWRIETIQLQCGICGGAGKDPLLKATKADCKHCSGSGWIKWTD